MRKEWVMIMMTESKSWYDFFEVFTEFGPLAGILLVMIEAFIPILPLSVFVAMNVMAFGFWLGYLYSWIGNVAGSLIVFFLIKKYGMAKFHKKIQKSKKIKNTFLWIKKHGFLPIFVLLTFPFTPSFLICGLSALAEISYKTFIYSIVFGKLIMILSLSFIGYNLTEFISHPIKSVLLISLTFSFSLIARFFMNRHEKKLDIQNSYEELGNLKQQKKNRFPFFSCFRALLT